MACVIQGMLLSHYLHSVNLDTYGLCAQKCYTLMYFHPYANVGA
jgi:hypothetical protein